jgi:hypothetical protein
MEDHGGMEVPEDKPPVTSLELVPARSVSSGLVSLDAAVGAVAIAGGLVGSMSRRLAVAVRPVGDVLLHPPLLPEHLHPARAVDALADRGRHAMVDGGADLERLIAAVVPAVVSEVLNTLDLNALIRERVDIDGLVATVDIAEIINRVDIDAIVARVDIDAIAKNVDIDAIAARIDIDAIVSRIDIDAIVAGVDIAAIIDRINVVGIAENVINEIDLPEIIRDSTGSMASQVVRDARMQTIDADEAISRLVDRILRRRRNRATTVPGQPGPPPGGSDQVPMP